MDNNKYFSIKNNNFNLISLILAIGVIYSHSFPLTLGSSGKDALSYLSKGQVDVGALSVNILFLISGFLIANSYSRCNGRIQYIKSRILRIAPALFTASIFSAIIIGALSTNLIFSDYIKTNEVWAYIVTLGLAPSARSLPGVFIDNIAFSAINGSLWTLRVQILLYGSLLFFNMKNFKDKKKLPTVLAVTIFLMYLISIATSFPLTKYIRLGHYFLLGVVFFLYHDKINYKNTKLFVSVLCLIGLTFVIGQGFNLVFGIFGAYFVFYLAFYKKVFPKFDKFGDISYGVYIYAFPIQQLLVELSNNTITPTVNFIIGSIIVLVLATLSWYFIEKPALSLKNKTFFKANILNKETSKI